ncbi:MAG: hypothetical protein JST30_14585 [Armatimonadetes bacterium]|nr:hypothetical protein [Armatimonadota bacterium]
MGLLSLSLASVLLADVQVARQVRFDGPGFMLAHASTTEKGKLVLEEWVRYPVGGSDQEPAQTRSVAFDAKSGETTVTKFAAFARDSSGKLQAAYAFQTSWKDGVPGKTTAQKAGPDGAWADVRFRVNGPRLIDTRRPFSVQVLEVIGSDSAPLARGSAVLWNGRVLPVGRNGAVDVPFAGHSPARLRFDFQVYPSLGDGPCLPFSRLSAGCRFATECVENPAASEPRATAADPVLSATLGVRVRGVGLSPTWTAALLDGSGGSFPLKLSVGSSFERIFIGDLPFVGRNEKFSLSAKGPGGNATNLPQTLVRSDFKVDHQRAELVGQRGTYTFTSNVDGWMRIIGGDPFIQLDEHVFRVSADKPKVVGYTGKMVGVYRVAFDLTPTVPESEDDPPCEAKCGTVTGKTDPATGKTTVEVPVELKDEKGKGLPGDCEVGVVHEGGVETGTVHCDKNGRGTFQVELGVSIDLTKAIGRVLSVPDRQIAAAPPEDECCIKEITFFNDSDAPVYYRVYNPKTKSSPRVEFLTTAAVRPGGSITVRGDFGHCVRAAALRQPAQFDDPKGVTGLVSDRQYCCHRHGEEEIRSSFEGLRTVVIVSEACHPAPPVNVPPPPEPPKTDPPPPTDLPKVDFGLDWKLFPKLSYPWPGETEGQPGLSPPPPPPASTPELQPSDGIEGWFEPVQSVWQDDEYFADQPDKRIVRLAPNAWRAELKMVAGKPTLVAGLLRDPDGAANFHYSIVLRGTTHGTARETVYLRVTLQQNGGSSLVYESPMSVDYLAVSGSPGPPQSFETRVTNMAGLPEENSTFRPFTFSPGPYELRAELVTKDGRPTGIFATVSGEAVTTTAPALYFMPAFLTPRTALQTQELMRATIEASRATGLWGQAVFPVPAGGMRCTLLPLHDFTKLDEEASTLGVTGWLWSQLVSSPEIAREEARTEGVAAALANFATVYSRLSGNGKVICVLDPDDFDRTYFKSDGTAAFTKNQKAIVIQRPFARWMTILHETTHASPFLWSVNEMQSEFSQVWHNNPVRDIGAGVKIFPNTPFRKRFDMAWPMMGPASVGDNDSSRWITQGAYKHLLDAFQAAPDPDVIDVSGVFARIGGNVKGRLAPVYTGSGVPDPAWNGKTEHAIVLKDASGKVLSRVPVCVDWTWGDAPRPRYSSSFSARIERPAGLAGIELVGPDGTLDRVAFSPAPPTLEWVGSTPRVTDGDRRVKLEWKGASSNGSPLLYSVLYSPDGEVWSDALVEKTATSVEFDFGGDLKAPVVKLVATDGSRSSESVLSVKG